jgi:2-polyprenyl-6-hydroxyphenyl methylase / 3-demethylubiquinone-9 3-methyltransferase
MDDRDDLVREAARVLRPRGVLLYDTVNRTALSKLIYLGALQSWRWTRIMPRVRYAPDRLRPPDELATAMSNHGLTRARACTARILTRLAYALARARAVPIAA